MHDRESHGKPIEQLVGELDAHLQNGLSSAQARERLGRLGANELTERPRPASRPCCASSSTTTW